MEASICVGETLQRLERTVFFVSSLFSFCFLLLRVGQLSIVLAVHLNVVVWVCNLGTKADIQARLLSKRRWWEEGDDTWAS